MWNYKGHSVTELPVDVVGMVYQIYYTDGTKYIGSKLVRTHKKMKPLKGMRVNANRREWKETNWKVYNSSSKLVEGKTIQSKVILYLTKDKRSMSYLEVKELMSVDASVNPEYVNENIGGKYFDNVLDGVYTGEVNQKGLFDEYTT